MAQLTWKATDLPVEAYLDQVSESVNQTAATRSLVLTAEPGAGKSSLVPLAVANGIANNNRVVVLEPRRIAARATALRLSELLGEQLGGTVGLTIRGQRAMSRHTRIEVVTEAVLTNRIQRDPELPGIGALVFDEFHERNLHSDLGLAMAIEAKQSLREDIALVVMSATLDPKPISALLDQAPTLSIPGRMFPVDTVHLQRPTRNAFPVAVADATRKALDAVTGDVLVFVPGRWEIDRVVGALASTKGVEVLGLHGGTPRDEQHRILQPSKSRRVIVATAVAETSITVPGVEAVVDGGLLRRANFDPVSGLGRLETRFATRFAADQRKGRAGRLGPGIVFRLWSADDDRLLDESVPPAIVDGDPLPVAFELAKWGDPFAETIPLLSHPGADRLQAGQDQLSKLGLTTPSGALNRVGKAASELPLHPRLGSLVLLGQSLGLEHEAATVAAVVESDQRQQTTDLLRAIDGSRRNGDVAQARKRIQRALRQSGGSHRNQSDKEQSDKEQSDKEQNDQSQNHQSKHKDPNGQLDDSQPRQPGSGGQRSPVEQPKTRSSALDSAPSARPPAIDELLARAWPDRVAIARPGRPGRFLLSVGREVEIRPSDPLHDADFLVVVAADGDPRSAKVRLAVQTTRATVLAACAVHITRTNEVGFDERSDKLKAEQVQKLGAITLHRQPTSFPSGPELEEALREGVRKRGLGLFQWSKKAIGVRQRLQWANEQDPGGWPSVTDDALLASLDDWLPLGNVRSPAQLRSIDLGSALLNRLSWQQRASFAQVVPTELPLPNGGTARVDYSSGRPVWAVRLQRLLGLDEHPRLGPAQVPITIELLSPANRPVQTTADLPGFWRGSYQHVRTDLRGRYPKHAWPADPLNPD